MAAVCQVDFYVLADGAMAPEQLACKLALKAWLGGHRIHVRTEDTSAANALDELMWTIPAERFIPHETPGTNAVAAVAIDSRDAEIAEDRNLVINLAVSAVPQAERFQRLLEIVPADDGQRTASREKFKKYRQLGMSPNHHPIEQV